MSTWTTRARETVTEGDLVALSVLRHLDAVGRIVGPGVGNTVKCELVRGRNCRAGDVVAVEEDQLLVRVSG